MKARPRLHDLLRALILAVAGEASALAAEEAPDVEGLSGRALMEEVYARHQQYPFVYEEQSMVLIDHRGDRMARRLQRYSRVEADGTARLMLLFTSPPEVDGVALLATRHPERTGPEEMDLAVYLPALGARLVESDGAGSTVGFLGTDFTIENLTGEDLDAYRYARRRSRQVDGVLHHVVDVFDARDDPATARPVRRHFVRARNLYVTRTDHYDELGRVEKRQTTHDLRPVDGTLWRGDMILMEDYRSGHRSLLKIDRRVFSRDYVPEEIFALEWLVANRPPRVAPEPDVDGPPDSALPDVLVRVEDGR
ncbi:MAG: outer membrane lipoprotein-sorting protein [Pseudomonadales bacterium]|jgi:hypothetical protein|nr:outer membrane lipoprotein-sorting protein [Pseudomonadales bacterium]